MGVSLGGFQESVSVHGSFFLKVASRASDSQNLVALIAIGDRAFLSLVMSSGDTTFQRSVLGKYLTVATDASFGSYNHVEQGLRL